MTEASKKSAIQAINGILKAVVAAENGAATLPARQSVKLRPSDWNTLCSVARSAVAQTSDEITSLRAERDALREENERVVGLLREATSDIVWSAYYQGIEKNGKWMDAARSDARQLQHDLGLKPGWHDAAEIKRRIPEATEIALKRAMEAQS